MDLQKIKQFIKNTGDTFVFVEEGEPSLVVMGFRDYDQLLRQPKVGKSLAGNAMQSANPHITVADSSLVAASFETERMRQQQEEVHAWGLTDLPRTEQRLENIRLEDLPL
jgi:hypothetical protein